MSVIKVEVKGRFTNLGTNRYSAEASSSWEPDNINTVTEINCNAYTLSITMTARTVVDFIFLSVT